MNAFDQTSDFEVVRQDPAAWYRQPQAILDDAGLSLAEKQSLLTEWAQDLADRSAATDEGMVPDVPALVDHDVHMQALVAAAQAQLAAATDAPAPSLVARIWRRITGADQPAAENVTE